MMALPLLAVQLALAADPSPVTYARPELLTEPADLIGFRCTVKEVVLDLRAADKYAAGHIPTAASAPLAAWSKAVTAGTADPAFWSTQLAAVGVRTGMHVTVYSDDPRDAARGWWMLKLAGVTSVGILNGGWDAYLAAGGKPAAGPDTRGPDTPCEWQPAPPRQAAKGDVLRIVKAGPGKVQVIDARSAGEFSGTDKLTNARGGHVPGAVPLEWTELLDPTTKKYRPAAELKALFAARKLDLGKPCVTYCQGGGRAAVVAFGLELMGADGVRNYYRSWAEWGNDPATPVEK